MGGGRRDSRTLLGMRGGGARPVGLSIAADETTQPPTADSPQSSTQLPTATLPSAPTLPLPTRRVSQTDALAAPYVEKRAADAAAGRSGVWDDMSPRAKAQTRAAACSPVTKGLPCPAGSTPCPHAAAPPPETPDVREAPVLHAVPTGGGGDTRRR